MKKRSSSGSRTTAYLQLRPLIWMIQNTDHGQRRNEDKHGHPNRTATQPPAVEHPRLDIADRGRGVTITWICHGGAAVEVAMSMWDCPSVELALRSARGRSHRYLHGTLGHGNSFAAGGERGGRHGRKGAVAGRKGGRHSVAAGCLLHGHAAPSPQWMPRGGLHHCRNPKRGGAVAGTTLPEVRWEQMSGEK